MFVLRRRVRYDEVDRMGVVHHGAFLRYFEEGRIEALRAMGYPHRRLEDEGLWFLVTGVRIRYRANTGYDAELLVETRVVRVGRATVTFGYRVREGQRLLAEGEVDLAASDGRGNVVRIPAPLRQALEKSTEGIAERTLV